MKAAHIYTARLVKWAVRRDEILNRALGRSYAKSAHKAAAAMERLTKR